MNTTADAAEKKAEDWRDVWELREEAEQTLDELHSRLAHETVWREEVWDDYSTSEGCLHRSIELAARDLKRLDHRLDVCIARHEDKSQENEQAWVDYDNVQFLLKMLEDKKAAEDFSISMSGLVNSCAKVFSAPERVCRRGHVSFAD